MEAAPPTRSNTRLAFWCALVAFFALVGYVARFSRGAGHTTSTVSVYSYSTFEAGILQYAVILGVIILICFNRFDLFALHAPRSWPRALGLAGTVAVSILVWEAIVSQLPLPQSPGREQGITTVHWEPAHAGAFAANVVLFAIVAPAVEELTFRGAGQSLWRFLGSTPSILIVGVAFGIWHGLVEALLVLIPLGLGLAWLRDRSESVLPGMLVHGLFNGAALALIFAS